MARGTHTGAAHPVYASGEVMDPIMKQKMENSLSAYVRSFTSPRARNPEMAVQGIVSSRAFSETEALDAKLIDIIAGSPEELVKKLDGREITRFDGAVSTLHLDGARIEVYEP